MNDMHNTLTEAGTMTATATNMGGKFWNTSKGAATFRSCGSKFGIINERGEALFHCGGEQPCVWATKKTAKEIAPYCGEFENHHWVKVYDSAGEAK